MDLETKTLLFSLQSTHFHFRASKSLDKKEFTVMAGMTDRNYQGEIGHPLYSADKEGMFGTQEIP